MEKLEAKTLALQQEIRELQEEVTAAKKGRKSPGGKPAASADVYALSDLRDVESIRCSNGVHAHMVVDYLHMS